jgi:AcrR family transcriptional regulator
MTSGADATPRTTPRASAKPAGAPRDAIVEALMRLLARREFAEVSISDIAREAGVSLADFRDCFPSKGAALAGFSRKIDRKVLDGPSDLHDAGPARDRLYEVLRRRLEAMAPYRDALAAILRWALSDPLALSALNREVVNSMRFMLEAADIDSEGAVGALKLQGLAFAWARVLNAWRQDDCGISDALSALDRELDRGEKFIDRAEDVARLTAPLRDFAGRLFRAGKHEPRAHERDDEYDGDDRRHRHDGRHPHASA